MVSPIIIGAVILGGALLLALAKKPKPVPAKKEVPAEKPPAEEELPKDVFTISVGVTFRGDQAYATMPLRGLVRIDPPPWGRELEWYPMQPTYSKKVYLGYHTIQVQDGFAGRSFIQYLVLPEPTRNSIIRTENPLTIWVNEDKNITVEFS